MTSSPHPRALSRHQLDTLAVLEGDLGAAVDELLRERGIPVRVSSIQLVPYEEPLVTPDGDIQPVPPTEILPPPGGVYTCWQHEVGGPWICVCGAV